MKIHLIAIGGAAMHNIALDLNLTHEVTGSDDEIYNPSRERLADAGLLPKEMGWYPDKITSDIDVVILGMHAKRDNPELQRAQELGLAIYSYPEFVFNQSKNKKRIVIAGSHGKTTTTSMIMHVLKKLGVNFDFLVGANIQGFERMVRLSDAPIIILEGDEYLSSPIDRRPKMLHYHPDIAVITGIAWDHINVFPTEEIYNDQFAKFVNTISDNGVLFYYQDDQILSEIVLNNQSEKVAVLGYKEYPNHEGITSDDLALEMSFFGSHNFQNMQAALHVLNQLDIDNHMAIKALQDFTGAHKRLQLLLNQEDFTAYLDFAHAPSKVKATVEAVSSQYPDRKTVAILELHTFSSLNREFIPHYKGTLSSAESAIVYYDPHTLEMKGMPALDSEFVRDQLSHPNLVVVHSAKELSTKLREEDLSNSCLLVMTSGNLGGLDIIHELKTL